MSDILTIRQCVRRTRDDGLKISEGALRRMVKANAVPVIFSGNRALIYYPNLVAHLTRSSA